MFIATTLTDARRSVHAATAAKANETVRDEMLTLRALHGAVKRDGRPQRPHGPLDGEGSEQRRRRWIMAYEATCAAYGLPAGSVYLPCYLCMDNSVFDAWTMDGEHIDPAAGTFTGNLALACHTHNRRKGDTGMIHAAQRQYLLDVMAGSDLPRGSVTGRAFFGARRRRKDGSDMAPRTA